MPIQVGVFFGGRSVEHEVSIISAMQAIAAIDRTTYNPIPVYMTKQGHWYTGPGYDSIESYRDLPALLKAGTRVVPLAQGERTALLRHPAKKFGDNQLALLDVALPVVHGTNVEDGTLQGVFDSLDLPYAGPDVLASAVGMDKAVAKTLLAEAGIPVLPHATLWRHAFFHAPDKTMEQLERSFPYPVIVKPANLGSSVGIARAGDREELQRALDEAFCFAVKVIVEPAIVNLREVNCSVLGSPQSARASVCEEPVSSDEILSYKDKYLSGGKNEKGMSGAKRRIPADLPAEQAQELQKMAVAAFVALGCRGVSRIDFLLDEDNGEMYVNEINTIPGSLSFYLWKASGLSFPALLDELIKLAMERKRERQNLSFSFETNLLQNASLGQKTNK